MNCEFSHVLLNPLCDSFYIDFGQVSSSQPSCYFRRRLSFGCDVNYAKVGWEVWGWKVNLKQLEHCH